MSRCVPLREIAHARAGDKGDRSNISLWVEDPRHYHAVKAQITPERLKSEFPRLMLGEIAVHALDHLCGLNIVADRALEGGVNASLNLDSHGKSFSFLVLGLTVEID
ncbi:MAG: hypothetical protein FJX46_00365 [Alphaproteobacteria bacterium]|nr:hypothetical protein [Alphaproteobacteria bacterium]